jgi:antitoxin VapB
MTLNIKNPEAHRLARELAALTGESMTAAVTEAVRERLARVRRERRAPVAAHLLAIGKDCAAHLKESPRSIDHADLLYGADGLPS